MKKISILRIRKILSSLHVNYQAFTVLEKTNEYTVVLTVTSRFLHDEDADLILGFLDEEYHVEKTFSAYEEYELTLR